MTTDDVGLWIERLRSVPVGGAFRVRKPAGESETFFTIRLQTYARYLGLEIPEWKIEADGRYLFRVRKYESQV